MDLHSLLYSYEPRELNHVQLVINAADLKKCFDDQEKWIRHVIKDATQPSYYTRHEVSKLLHISLPTIYSYVESGRLPKPIKQGRRILFEQSAVNYLIRKNTPEQ